jgi:D-sedoheptulose 7-phosphate isomerase
MSIEIIKERLLESIKIKSELLNSSEIQNKINKIAEIICDTLKKGGKVIFAGNGGSCSDAFHLAGEFVARFMFDRDPLPAIALGANNSIITAIGNDYSYEQIFSREIAVLGNSGDVFLVFSTSGNSPNILGAVEIAKRKSYTFLDLQEIMEEN